MTWKKISSKIIYQNPWMPLREDSVITPAGKKGIYSVLQRPHVNFIIAINNDKKICFVSEYRYPVQKIILQLPAGTTDPNHSDLQSAKQELLEEAGLEAKQWIQIGNFFIGAGHEDVLANVFVAQDLIIKKNDSPSYGNTDEDIKKINFFSKTEILDLIVTNKIECGITLASLNILFAKKLI